MWGTSVEPRRARVNPHRTPVFAFIKAAVWGFLIRYHHDDGGFPSGYFLLAPAQFYPRVEYHFNELFLFKFMLGLPAAR